MTGSAAVILVRPKHPGNVGSTCRVIRNMGLERLLLVGCPVPREDGEARKMAYNSLAVLEAAQEADTLAEACRGFDLCIGTSARRGRDRRTPMTPRRLMSHLLENYPACRVALVFGPEESGLTSEELELCQFTVEIPTSPEHPSMNLSHAVAVLGYEWRVATLSARPEGRLAGVSNQRMSELLRVLEAFLREVRYPTRTSIDRAVADARRVLLASPMTERDVKTLMGLLRHLGYPKGSDEERAR